LHFPPVGLVSTFLQLLQAMTDWAWLNTTLVSEHPPHFTSIKYESGEGTSLLSLWASFCDSSVGFNKSVLMLFVIEIMIIDLLLVYQALSCIINYPTSPTIKSDNRIQNPKIESIKAMRVLMMDLLRVENMRKKSKMVVLIIFFLDCFKIKICRINVKYFWIFLWGFVVLM